MTITPRPWLAQVPPYIAGRPSTTAHGSLASNESALGGSPCVRASIDQMVDQVHRYPDPLASALRQELGRLHGVAPQSILVGNGSDELILLLAMAYLAHGGHAVCATPAYKINVISALVANARLTTVPLLDGAHDLERMAQVEADIAFIVNPHNPTGSVKSIEDIAWFAHNSPAKLVLVDEAYVDFMDDPVGGSALTLIENDRVAVLRTFSKVYGLAGLRVGYMVAAPEIIDVLRRVRAPFSVNAVAQAGALAAVRDRHHWATVREFTIRTRTEMVALLAEAGLAPLPSSGNFVLVGVPDETSAVEHFRLHGVTVRPGATLGVPGHVRISVPSETGLAMLRTALSTFPVS